MNWMCECVQRDWKLGDKGKREIRKYKRGHQNGEVKLQGKEENGKGKKQKGRKAGATKKMRVQPKCILRE